MWFHWLHCVFRWCNHVPVWLFLDPAAMMSYWCSSELSSLSWGTQRKQTEDPLGQIHHSFKVSRQSCHSSPTHTLTQIIILHQHKATQYSFHNFHFNMQIDFFSHQTFSAAPEAEASFLGGRRSSHVYANVWPSSICVHRVSEVNNEKQQQPQQQQLAASCYALRPKCFLSVVF